MLEGLINGVVVLRAGLDVVAAKALSERLGIGGGNFTTIGAVSLVSYEQHGGSGASELLHILHPDCDVVKRLTVRDVEHQHDAVSAAVVGVGDGAEALLASGVPQLQLDDFILTLEGQNLEVYANGGNIVRVPVLIGVAVEQGALANAAVSDDDGLDGDVVVNIAGTNGTNGHGLVWSGCEAYLE